ncbi:unnamed protein product, partial [Staurois parvus]
GGVQGWVVGCYGSQRFPGAHRRAEGQSWLVVALFQCESSLMISPLILCLDPIPKQQKKGQLQLRNIICHWRTINHTQMMEWVMEIIQCFLKSHRKKETDGTHGTIQILGQIGERRCTGTLISTSVIDLILHQPVFPIFRCLKHTLACCPLSHFCYILDKYFRCILLLLPNNIHTTTCTWSMVGILLKHLPRSKTMNSN